MPSTTLAAQLAKLEARRPELAAARIFLTPPQRLSAPLWWALLDEIEEACFELSEPFIAQAKLGWWAEELVRGAAGNGRHPLLQALFALPCTQGVQAAHWGALPQAAGALLERGLSPADSHEALALLGPLAAAVDRLELDLFGGEGAAPGIAADLLLRRHQRAEAGHHAQARLPRNLLARHALAPAQLSEPGCEAQRRAFARDLASELQPGIAAAAAGLCRPRALQMAVLRWRLARLSEEGRVGAPAGLGLLFGLWRTARRSA